MRGTLKYGELFQFLSVQCFACRVFCYEILEVFRASLTSSFAPFGRSGCVTHALYADASYADASYADASYADASYADASYVDASYADASYADASYADASYADALYVDA